MSNEISKINHGKVLYRNLKLSLLDFELNFRFAFVQSFKSDASLANFVACHESAALAVLLVDGFAFLLDFYLLSRVNDVQNGLWSLVLKLLYKFSDVTSISEGTIDTLR